MIPITAPQRTAARAATASATTIRPKLVSFLETARVVGTKDMFARVASTATAAVNMVIAVQAQHTVAPVVILCLALALVRDHLLEPCHHQEPLLAMDLLLVRARALRLPQLPLLRQRSPQTIAVAMEIASLGNTWDRAAHRANVVPSMDGAGKLTLIAEPSASLPLGSATASLLLFARRMLLLRPDPLHRY